MNRRMKESLDRWLTTPPEYFIAPCCKHCEEMCMGEDEDCEKYKKFIDDSFENERREVE